MEVFGNLKPALMVKEYFENLMSSFFFLLEYTKMFSSIKRLDPHFGH